nr:RNA-directed DNA polymerase, eukaryota [Tanacetum cinerariifolium]
MSKSKILGVNVDDDYVKQAASKLGCLQLKCPFLYLGTKVGGSMSRVDSWNEVVDKKTSLWTRVIKAIHGEDDRVNSMEVSGVRSCWKNIVFEVQNLKHQGVNVDDFMQLKIGNGESVSFWKDNWQGGGALKTLVPRLFALENCKDVKLNALEELVERITLAPIEDIWNWSLDSSGEFSVSSIRKFIDKNRIPSAHSKTRWVKYMPIKVNVLAWKIKMDVQPTRLNISRRGMDIPCLEFPCCVCGVESSAHLFFKCDLVRQIARKISGWWNVPYADCISYDEWTVSWKETRIRSPDRLLSFPSGFSLGMVPLKNLDERDSLVPHDSTLTIQNSLSVRTLICSFGANPTVYELDEHPEGQKIEKELKALGCKPSVPAIFIGQELVGGANEIMSMHLKGKLVPLLIKERAIWL